MRAVTGIERTFGDDEFIVSKTDPGGRITYANHVFTRVSGYTPSELVGTPHNLVRHPSMPRGVFKLLWDTLAAGQEVFAYVINLTKGGDHYWVFAHITPSFDPGRKLVGYHSNRRTPNRLALPAVQELYAQMLQQEAALSDRRAAAAASCAWLERTLGARGLTYEQLVFELEARRAAA